MSTTSVQGSDDVVEVVLGVHTHLDVHVVVALDQFWAGGPWASFGRTDGQEGLPQSPLVGGGFRSREVRRDRGNQQLWGRTRPPLEGGRGDRGSGGSPEAQAPPSPAQRQVGPPIDAQAAARERCWPARRQRRAQECSRRLRGDDLALERAARRWAVKAKTQEAANQLSPGLTGDHLPRGAPIPFARSLDKRTLVAAVAALASALLRASANR